jgi:hypothetical protein
MFARFEAGRLLILVAISLMAAAVRLFIAETPSTVFFEFRIPSPAQHEVLCQIEPKI